MKCLLVLFYGPESYPLNKSQAKSLDFAIDSAFSKSFSTKYHYLIVNCMALFNCQPTAVTVSKRKHKFLSKYINSRNFICKLFASKATERVGQDGGSLSCV